MFQTLAAPDRKSWIFYTFSSESSGHTKLGQTMKCSVVILAAGQGTRMYSSLPKVLHSVAGVSMLERVVQTAQKLSPKQIHVIYGHQGERVKAELAHLPVNWIEQAEQLGTGHAMQQALPYIGADESVLVLYADVPAISAKTLQMLVAKTSSSQLGVITAQLDDPAALGRVIRDQAGAFQAIVEYKDATAEQRQIKEINSGLYYLPGAFLHQALPNLSNQNQQAEFYLTDILAMAVQANVKVATIQPDDVHEVMGVNDRVQLAIIERHLQAQQAHALMQQGVTLSDPSRFDLRGKLTCGNDVFIDANVTIEGSVSIGSNCRIGSQVILKNCQIEAGVTIHPFSLIEDAVVESHATIGPYARLRPQAHIQRHAKVGNFVEIKKATIGHHSKVNHLSYIGDATVGSDVNIGAGTITCNYDGVKKHQTVINRGAFIGSGTQLVAPVEVGAKGYIGAGSTITKNTPEGKLSLSRAKQFTLNNWVAPINKETEKEND